MSDKNKRNSSSKWSISKASYSKTSYFRVSFPDNYFMARKLKLQKRAIELPYRESFYKHKVRYRINICLLKNFLYSYIGKDWNFVYSELVRRIPVKHFEFDYHLNRYVADKIEKREDGLWNSRTQKYLNKFKYHRRKFADNRDTALFYVDPDSNILKQVQLIDFYKEKYKKIEKVEEVKQKQDRRRKIKRNFLWKNNNWKGLE